MSLIPYWMRHLRNAAGHQRPTRLFEDDIFSVFAKDPFFRDPAKYMQRFMPEMLSNHNIDGALSANEVKIDGKKLEIQLDVRNFKPDDINVKSVGDEILIEGKSEIKRDSGWTKSHFERRFVLPDGFPPERVECHFDKGKLLVVAFRAEPIEEKKIPITDKSSASKEDKIGSEKTQNINQN